MTPHLAVKAELLQLIPGLCHLHLPDKLSAETDLFSCLVLSLLKALVLATVPHAHFKKHT